MHRHSTQQQILYLNLELLKNSYKLEEPHQVSSACFHSHLKLQTTTTQASENLGEPPALELNCNAFSKMKQLFRKRQHSSIISDDLTNSHIFSIQSKNALEKVAEVAPGRFQFDSFGGHEATTAIFQRKLPQIPTNELNEDLKGWNSSSFEINFEKSGRPELRLPEGDHSLNNSKINIQRNEPMESSIKQFCFKINQDRLDENVKPVADMELTPVKKWTEQKKNKVGIISERIMTQAAPNEQSGKNILKRQIYDCLQALQSAKEQKLTAQIVNDTKGLLSCVKSQLMGVQKKLSFAERDRDFSERELREQEAKTLRIKNSNCQLKHPVQAKQSDRDEVTAKCRRSGNFKIYECKDKQLPNRSQPKLQKKGVRQQNRFRF